MTYDQQNECRFYRSYPQDSLLDAQLKRFFMSLIRFTKKWAPILKYIFIESFTETSGFPAFATDVVPSSSVAGKGNLFHSAMHTRFRFIFKFHIGHSKPKFNFDPYLKMSLHLFALLKKDVQKKCFLVENFQASHKT